MSCKLNSKLLKIFEKDKSSFALFEMTRDLTTWGGGCISLVGGAVTVNIAKNSSGSLGKDERNWYVFM